MQNRRTSTVGRETIRVRGARDVVVGGGESLRTRGTRSELVGHEYQTTVEQDNRVIRVLDGTYDLLQSKGSYNRLVLEELGASLVSQARIQCSASPDPASDAALLVLDAGGDVELASNETKVEVRAKTELKLLVGDSASVTITESSIHVHAPTVRITADNLIDLKSVLVKINCD